MITSPLTSEALESAITSGASVALATAMLAGQYYSYTANVDSWILQSDAGSPATAGSGSMFTPAGVALTLDGANGSHLSCIADSTSGKASTCRMVRF